MKIIQKLVIIVAAIAINVAVLAWFHAWTTVVVANATPSPGHADKILTLPVINVHPSAAQLRALRHTGAMAAPEQADVAGRHACLVMPFYSFAERSTACAEG